MGYDFDKTHDLILKNAMIRFTESGFRDASIRQICKDSGVTNGAFYSHFKSKEDLFSQLVEPVIKGLDELYIEENSRYGDVVSEKDLEDILRCSFSSDRVLVGYIYENAAVFRMLLCASGGTGYEGFREELARKETEATLAFLQECTDLISRPENISEGLINRISSFLISAVFDSFLEGKEEKETIRQAQLASQFCLAGLKSILGIG